uniref:Uncharacterized protein n=1 Tax=Anguilla anguilla TaxID=7936 RepID=A0A0E9VUH1_ANGAN
MFQVQLQSQGWPSPVPGDLPSTLRLAHRILLTGSSMKS